MPGKNTIGGKGYKRAKQSSGFEQKHVLLTADKNQQYALVLKRAGGQFVDVKCADGKIRKAFIRGALRKRVWLNPGDIIIVSVRDFTADDKKCDIIHKYIPEDVKKLEIAGLLPEDFIEKQKISDDIFDFENSENESDNDDAANNNVNNINVNNETESENSENELDDDDIDNI